MMNYSIVQAHELQFNMSLNDEITAEFKKDIKMAFLFVLQYQKGNDASAIHSVVRFVHKDKVFFEGGVTLVFKSSVWDEMDKSEAFVRKSDFARELIAYSLPYLSGVMLAKTKGTPMESLMLPNIDASELVENIKVEEVK